MPRENGAADVMFIDTDTMKIGLGSVARESEHMEHGARSACLLSVGLWGPVVLEKAVLGGGVGAFTFL